MFIAAASRRGNPVWMPVLRCGCPLLLSHVMGRGGGDIRAGVDAVGQIEGRPQFPRRVLVRWPDRVVAERETVNAVAGDEVPVENIKCVVFNHDAAVVVSPRPMPSVPATASAVLPSQRHDGLPGVVQPQIMLSVNSGCRKDLASSERAARGRGGRMEQESGAQASPRDGMSWVSWPMECRESACRTSPAMFSVRQGAMARRVKAPVERLALAGVDVVFG